MNPPENQREVEVSEEALQLAEQNISRLLERGFELYDRSGVRLRFAPDSALASTAARAALQAAAPVLCAQERERLLGELLDWLGADTEYDALGALVKSLKANPQLVPERDVPLRLLQATRAVVERFAEQDGGDSISTIRQQAAQQERERVKEALLGEEAINSVSEVLDDEFAAETSGEAVTDYALAKRVLTAALTTLDKEGQ